MNIILNDFKYETVNSLSMKPLAPIANKPYSSYDQTSADLIQWTLLKSPEEYSHALQFTKQISSMKLEGGILHQIQKLWGSIPPAFCQYFSTNKSWPE